ncbi:MAG: hypothetical protein L0J44_12375 [Tetragenococcus koreensis]|nr:hypothetical protein [Tetragenococcus koreensis]
MNNYRKMITILYDECFPEKSFPEEFLSWRKSAQILFIVLMITSCILVPLMTLQKWWLGMFVSICAAVSSLFVLVYILKKDQQTFMEYFKVKEQQLKNFDKKLSLQGIVEISQIYNFIDYLTYNSNLNKQIKNEKSKTKRTLFASLFIPGFLSLGGELWQLIKINIISGNLIVITLEAIICFFIVMLAVSEYFSHEKIFRFVDLDKDDKISIALKEVIIYRNGTNPTLDNRKDV